MTNKILATLTLLLIFTSNHVLPYAIVLINRGATTGGIT